MDTKSLEEKREEFVKDFYKLWDAAGFGLHDTESSYPQGMPWLVGADHDLEDPEAYFLSIRDEIAAYKKEESEHEE